MDLGNLAGKVWAWTKRFWAWVSTIGGLVGFASFTEDLDTIMGYITRAIEWLRPLYADFVFALGGVLRANWPCLRSF